MQERRCIECDELGIYFCSRCDTHLCEHHCITHRDFKICAGCLTQTCIEMMGFPQINSKRLQSFNEQTVDELCFRCRSKNTIDKLNDSYKTIASELTKRSDKDNFNEFFETALGIASMSSALNRSTAKI